MARDLHVRGGFVAAVDDDVWEWAKEFSWFMRNGYPCRYLKGSAYGTKDYSERYLHHEVAGRMESDRGIQVHHKGENPLNCRRENLVKLTVSQHRLEHTQSLACRTTKLDEGPKRRQDGRPGYKGVAWHPRLDGWQVMIAVNGRNVFLGRYSDPEEAALVYDAAVLYYRDGVGYKNLLPDSYADTT